MWGDTGQKGSKFTVTRSMKWRLSSLKSELIRVNVWIKFHTVTWGERVKWHRNV